MKIVTACQAKPGDKFVWECINHQRIEFSEAVQKHMGGNINWCVTLTPLKEYYIKEYKKECGRLLGVRKIKHGDRDDMLEHLFHCMHVADAKDYEHSYGELVCAAMDCGFGMCCFNDLDAMDEYLFCSEMVAMFLKKCGYIENKKQNDFIPSDFGDRRGCPAFWCCCGPFSYVCACMFAWCSSKPNCDFREWSDEPELSEKMGALYVLDFSTCPENLDDDDIESPSVSGVQLETAARARGWSVRKDNIVEVLTEKGKMSNFWREDGRRPLYRKMI